MSQINFSFAGMESWYVFMVMVIVSFIFIGYILAEVLNDSIDLIFYHFTRKMNIFKKIKGK